METSDNDRVPQFPDDPPDRALTSPIEPKVQPGFWSIPLWMQALGSHLYTHNPFYLISSGLVLFGLQTSFGDNHQLANGWLLMELLCGYALLLAGVGCLIVRCGNVWEDARMVLLVILLLFVALSNSFDRFVLDDYISGGQLLAVGFLFTVVMTESLFFFLPMRLAARYRIPFYLQLALLFSYPVWLAYLSIEDYPLAMAWSVFLFPVFGAITLLTLLPAARWAGKGEPASGTPWHWPWYPWPVFVFLGAGMMFRSYSLSLSFVNAGGMEAAFQLYFLLPLLLACVALIIEACLATGHRSAANWMLLVPFLLFPLSLPGPIENGAQLTITLMLDESVGAPARLYLFALVLFYFIAWIRKLPPGEICTLLVLGLLSVIGPGTRAVGALQHPIWQPLAVAVLLELIVGMWTRHSLRILVGTAGLLIAGFVLGRKTNYLPGQEVYLLFAGLLIVLLVGLLCRDGLARRIRRQTPKLLVGGSWAIAAIGVSRVPIYAELAMLASLAFLAFVAWKIMPDLANLLAVVTSSSSASVLLVEPVYRATKDTILAKGMYWLLAGIVTLLAGLLISLQKGKQLRRIRDWLESLNQALAKP